eukprot:TRINITY_DN571_c0_g1_i1.p1 TRINITY_DN571_c0_g1~~TRINITY_DN571_c0_g1_i1.p1  ORF type:complete len:140 (-),score=18.52 TRINITY_DN571_c0_g1_i1:85-504(-)
MASPNQVFCKNVSDCNPGEQCEGCLPKKCKCEFGNTKCTKDCLSTCKLGLDLICKSGGIETGFGISRINDCSKGLVCKPKKNVFAIGGEIDWTCQDTCPTDFQWPPADIRFCSGPNPSSCKKKKNVWVVFHVVVVARRV